MDTTTTDPDAPAPRGKANPFAARSPRRRLIERGVRQMLHLATYFILLCALFIFGDIFVKGAPVIFGKQYPGFVNTRFFTHSPETLVVFENPEGEEFRLDYQEFEAFKAANPDFVVAKEQRNSYSGGGILGPLVGTALLTLICIVVALFIGLAAAIYLNEYGSHGRFMNAIRLAILNLAGVPSIVFGLFGLGLFCLTFPLIVGEANLRAGAPAFELFHSGVYLSFQGFGISMLAGGLTLAVMILPVIITACEESLKAIPMGFREASLALGATKWQSIRTAVLPYALPGMLTASVLGITRVAGETAPIMFTAAAAHKDKLPWQEAGEGGFLGFFGQSVQAMPYHIYTVAARIPQSEYTKPMQYGSVFVFMVLVMLLASLSVYLRIHFRGKLKW
ncbi:MAG: phosphate ABC transporter permease PstA [Verrucomicrobiae bacterium]|nr:phosphate ABC transporter permease PstA [Verrucomicrobiae bacterium]